MSLTGDRPLPQDDAGACAPYCLSSWPNNLIACKMQPHHENHHELNVTRLLSRHTVLISKGTSLCIIGPFCDCLQAPLRSHPAQHSLPSHEPLMPSAGTAAPASTSAPAAAPASTSAMQLRVQRKPATPTNSGSTAARSTQPKKVEEFVCEVWSRIAYLLCCYIEVEG